MHRLSTVAALAALALTGCPDDDPGGAADADAAIDGDVSEVEDTTLADTSVAEDASDEDTSGADAAEDTSIVDSSDPDTAADTALDTSVDTSGPWEWPWPEATVDVPAHASWKGQLVYPDEPFRSAVASYDHPAPRWVKLAVFTGDPTRVYFQDSNAYDFHYDFAEERLPPFYDLSRDAFDQATLHNSPDRAAILGAVLYAPDADTREIGVQLVSQDVLDPRVVDVLFDLIVDAVDPGDGGPVEAFYFPTFEQRAAVAADAAWYAALDVPVSGPERWADGNACYASGWAVGRLTWVPGDQIDAAYAAGTLLPTDILLTDGVPAEVPYVAGVVTLAPSTPSSHVAILSQTFGVPFAWLALPEDAAAAQALVGHEVALRAGAEDGFGACLVELFDVDGLLPAADREALLALKAPAALDLPAKATYGALTEATDGLTSADTKYFGGKAANFGLLRRTIPDNAPDPAIAISFDLWDAFMDQTLEGTGATLRADIDARLAAYTWPPDMAALEADLAAVRDLVEDATAFTDAQRSALVEALGVFDPDAKIRFRSSTNVEDTAAFVGAGLYSSYSGCLADDLDGDDAGPSLCDPSKAKERGVFRAIRKVYASFWNDNAFLERLRRGVDEGDVGMAVLVHHSFPDEIELANGVATLDKNYSAAYQLVTQLGAVSVTNPDTAALPEVVSAAVYSFGTYLTFEQASSLVVLGDHVMTWEDDYQTLVGLLEQVNEAFAAGLPANSAYTLDFEYKRVVPGDLVVKQVRQLPRPSNEATVPTYLLPSAAPLRRCVRQGEYGSVWGIHRGKLQLTLSNAGTWLDASSLATPFYVDANATLRSLSDGGEVALTGAPSTWPGDAHDVDGAEVTTTWTDGAGAELRTFGLVTAVTPLISPARAPIYALADLYLQVRVDYATPQLEIDWSGEPTTTTTDWVRLGGCPDDEVITADHLPISRSVTAGGVTVEIDFWWPPAPTGIVAGYTAPLAKWEQTTITGLTADPIVLESDWSQTYRPGHHNFSEEFLFEPRREPELPQATLDALAAADVWMVHVNTGSLEGQISIVGFDGELRAPKTE